MRASNSARGAESVQHVVEQHKILNGVSRVQVFSGCWKQGYGKVERDGYWCSTTQTTPVSSTSHRG